jgi:PAS domain S-box-containing protein
VTYGGSTDSSLFARWKALQPPGAWLEALLAVLVLLPAVVYPARLQLLVRPMLPFVFDDAGRVLWAVPCDDDPRRCPLQGDLIVGISGKPAPAADRASLEEAIGHAVGSGGVLDIEIRRGDEVFTVQVPAEKGRASAWRAVFMASGPLSFWLAGTAGLLFLRPRGERRWVVVLLAYSATVWVGAGFASGEHLAGARFLFHTFFLLFVPLTLHLHLLLPFPRLTVRARRWVLGALYVAAASAALRQAWSPSPGFGMASLLLLTVTVGICSALLMAPARHQRTGTARRAGQLMLFGLIAGLMPTVIFNLLRLLTGYPERPGPQHYMVALTLPLLPFAYAKAVALLAGGSHRVRSNRVFSVYAYVGLGISVLVPALTLLHGSLGAGRAGIYPTLALCAAFAAFMIVVRRPFTKRLDSLLFGAHVSVRDLLPLALSRVIAAFDRATLASSLSNDILPALLVRQSALVVRTSDGAVEVLCDGVDPPSESAVRQLVAGAEAATGEAGDIGGVAPAWARLWVPLTVGGRESGAWLLGARDPDDHYTADDRELLRGLGSQIAQMLDNIHLLAKARAEVEQRRAAEAAAIHREERFRALFESTFEGIAILRGGVIAEVNTPLVQLLGFPANELLGAPVSRILVEPALLASPGSDLMDADACRSDGSLVQVELARRHHTLMGEEVTVVAMRDLAERRRREVETRRLQEQLLLAQKMEAVGRLSAGLAHDFNNCLQAVLGYTDLLLARYDQAPLLSHHLAGIRDAGQRGAALSRQLLAFARRQPTEPVTLDLNATIRDLSKMLRRLLPEDIEIVADLQPGSACVRFDAVQLEQVIVNLAVNARDAMPDGGQFRLQTRPYVVAATDFDDGIAPGTYWLLTLSDDGIGMDDETLSHAFEPFFTTKREGSGLGLSIVYGLVEQNSGKVRVHSRPGAGTHFAIYLPAASGEPVIARDEAWRSAPRGWEDVLLVEDNEHVRISLSHTLRSLGYRVLDAASGEEALLLADDVHHDIAALVTDLRMPGIDGQELARVLSQQRPDLCTLFMSGYSEREVPVGGIRSVWLQKPFPAEMMATTLRNLLDQRRSA